MPARSALLAGGFRERLTCCRRGACRAREFPVHLEPSARALPGTPQHLAAGGVRVLPQAACVLPAQAATHYGNMPATPAR